MFYTKRKTHSMFLKLKATRDTRELV